MSYAPDVCDGLQHRLAEFKCLSPISKPIENSDSVAVVEEERSNGSSGMGLDEGDTPPRRSVGHSGKFSYWYWM
ncbi:hypothetical protein KCU81_g20, partial [Aureobasidium melanogenum]